MKNTVCLLILLTCGLAGVAAQDATSLQVAPSDQVKYPDASEILNKTEPKTEPKTEKNPAVATVPATPPVAPPLATAKPLLASTPVAVKPAPAPRAEPTARAETERGWFLKWTVVGDEFSALGWVQDLALPASLSPLGNGQWEVWAGPLPAASLGDALRGQGGLATLVRK